MQYKNKQIKIFFYKSAFSSLGNHQISFLKRHIRDLSAKVILKKSISNKIRVLTRTLQKMYRSKLQRKCLYATK
jgi:hypothetical protein